MGLADGTAWEKEFGYKKPKEYEQWDIYPAFGDVFSITGDQVPQDKTDVRRRSGYCFYFEYEGDIITISAMGNSIKKRECEPEEKSHGR